MVDPLLDPLNLIVPISCPVICCFLNYLFHVLRSLNLAQVHNKSSFKVLYGFFQKAWQSWMVHQLDDISNMFKVFPSYEKSFYY